MYSTVQVRIHGRGGQGVVTTSEILALAAFLEGKHAQAFPSFGSERTGAPVASFVRIADRPIRTHEPVVAPDAVLVQDSTLLAHDSLLAGLSPSGWLVVNSSRPPEALGLVARRSGVPAQVVTVPATDIAVRAVGRAVPGPALLGAFAHVSGVVGLDALVAAIRQRLGGDVGEANAAAASEAYAVARRRASTRKAVDAPAG